MINMLIDRDIKYIYAHRHTDRLLMINDDYVL